MTPADLQAWLPVAPWLAAIAVVALVVVKIWPLLRKLGHFLDDVAGEPARPGVPARPGLMERLSAVESDTKAIHHEVFPNSGGSLRDQVDLLRGDVGDLKRKLDNDNARLEAIETALKEKP